MGWNDRLESVNRNTIEMCPKCGQQFECITEEQVPGFRMKDEKICPYCEEILATSMSEEFICKQLTNTLQE